MHYRTLFLCALLACAIVATACSRRPRSTADVPRVVPMAFQVTVAPFTQPTDTGELILGQLPEDQGRIETKDLPALDTQFRHVLNGSTKRSFVYATAMPRIGTGLHSSAQPQGLPRWLAYGRAQKAQLLLVPLVLTWHEREGSKAGVIKPAHVRLEFFLLRVSDGTIAGRSVFEEKQEGLADNLLTVGAFIKRRGAWVSANDLAAEAMAKAIKELGL